VRRGGPEFEFRFSVREIINFHVGSPTSITKILFFMIVSATAAQP